MKVENVNVVKAVLHKNVGGKERQERDCGIVGFGGGGVSYLMGLSSVYRCVHALEVPHLEVALEVPCGKGAGLRWCVAEGHAFEGKRPVGVCGVECEAWESKRVELKYKALLVAVYLPRKNIVVVLKCLSQSKKKVL